MKTAIKSRPILFSGPMVQAILDGRKTQTRRIVKPQPLPETDALRDIPDENRWYAASSTENQWGVEYRPLGSDQQHEWKCPYGKIGDQLWVRETWRVSGDLLLATEGMTTSQVIKKMKARHERCEYDESEVCYAADEYPNEHPGEYKPSIFMPRIASRITLEITDIRVERLHDISETDAQAEGVATPQSIASDRYWPTYRDGFRDLWQKINGDDSWFENPWVWCIGFQLVAS